MNTNGNYYVNRLRRRESFKRLINIGLSAICLFLEIALFAYMWQLDRKSTRLNSSHWW